MNFTDNAVDTARKHYGASVIQAFCGDVKVFIAEDISDKKDLGAVCSLANKRKDLKFIFIPYEIYEEKLNEIIASIDGKCLLCSECTETTCFDGVQVLVIDFLGSSPWVYEYCACAYLGGLKPSMHKVKELAARDIPVALRSGTYAKGACAEFVNSEKCKIVHSGSGLFKWLAVLERDAAPEDRPSKTRRGSFKYNMAVFGVKMLSCIPFRAIYVLSDCVCPVFYHLVRYRRGIVHRNITEAFPEKGPAEIRKMERNFYRFFTDMALECCKLATMSEESIRRHMVFRNTETVNSLLGQGKSVAIYLGHYGNWEWVSSLPLWLDKGAASAQIYHKLSNGDMNELMMRIRERMGAVCVDMHKTARYVARQNAGNKVCAIGFIADQAPRMRDAHHYLDFLNHDVPVLTGTEKIIKHYGFEAFYLDVRKIRRGYYEAVFVKLHDEPRMLPDFELTDLYFMHLEQTIRRRPELYLWSHKRFRNARGKNKDASTGILTN